MDVFNEWTVAIKKRYWTIERKVKKNISERRIDTKMVCNSNLYSGLCAKLSIYLVPLKKDSSKFQRTEAILAIREKIRKFKMFTNLSLNFKLGNFGKYWG